MEITFEQEFMGSGNRLSQQQRDEFYEKMKKVAVQICVVDRENVYEGGTFWIRRSSGGSGFLVSKDGHILTNSHVVNDNTKRNSIVFICEPDSTLVVEATGEEAIVIYDDPTSDVAILKVKHPGREYDYAKLGKEEDIFVGMEVFSISHPIHFYFSFLIGYVSCSRMAYGDCLKDENGLIDATLPVIEIKNLHLGDGASGGPLFDSKGSVIGMNMSVTECGYDIAIHIQKLSQICSTHLTTSSSSDGKC